MLCAPVEMCTTIGGGVVCKRAACGMTLGCGVWGGMATMWRQQDLGEMALCGNLGVLLGRFGGDVISL